MCKPKVARDKSKLAKIRKTLRENTGTRQVIQKKPCTCVVVYTKYSNKEYQAIGFSKVCYPDAWDKYFGVDLAHKKAIYQLAREIYDQYYAESD